MLKRVALWVVIGLLVLFAVIQLIPYGRDHTNPPVVREPAWDSPATRELAKGACFDCHSNETAWPWYANIAPSSWLLQRDVDGGRSHLNFSEWGTAGRGGGEIAAVVAEGEMPPWTYAIMHSDARLSDQERQALVDGLAQLE